ncbi:kynurenine 3-monooxygenase [Galendromus occidentalis]|uniref:Kynurenine 3-monooxygenase n=1 Tax=Galendromus occidentalis TaxID=34638 RepID=A0AAJ6VUW5_9ACAR|nr:kynurenine 3-monooxygenase [Galendromus occidentalis]
MPLKDCVFSPRDIRSSTRHSRTMDQQDNKIAVVGAGLVGAACACMLSRHGFAVDLFELRSDLRLSSKLSVGRSINLALSARGLHTLRLLGVADEILERHAIPMYARMIHNVDGRTEPIPYGASGQCIYSVGRKYLLELLLFRAERDDNVRLHFDHKLLRARFHQGSLEFSTPDRDAVTKSGYRAIIGCDGVFSRVRQDVMRCGRFDFEQKYIDHGYIELCIPAKDNEFQMAVNFLHIWPRGEFMMIALPNQDKSYTVTLFMPFEKFEALTTAEKILKFFETHFPDSIPLIGRESLIQTLTTVEVSSLASVKCSPYHVGGRGLLLGDAAHAMVPFYGQGMNCGFEDVSILDELFTALGTSDLEKPFETFSEVRREDAHAIVELALYNYIEMRHLVNSVWFRLRKKFDSSLHWMFPKFWVPLYTSVTFSRMKYSECISNRAWQDKVLRNSLRSIGLLALGVSLAYAASRMRINVRLH